MKHLSQKNNTLKKSFRDPSGFVLIDGNNVYRGIEKNCYSMLNTIFNSQWFIELVNLKKIQPSKWIKNKKFSKDFLWLKHPKFNFPLFAHEICAEQLFISGKLTLELAKKSLINDYILKDASAWNVVYENGKPIFCDVTSFEPYNGSSIWVAYGQFCRHFIIPLILHKYLRISPAELFIHHRDGVSPLKAKKLLGYRSFTSLMALETIYLPSLMLKGKTNLNKKINLSADKKMNQEILLNTLSRLDSYITKLQPSKFVSKSTWSDYQDCRAHYRNEDLKQKREFVYQSLKECKLNVLDLGCNQGEYSLIAAGLGLNTVATDFDENALIKFQSQLFNEKISISLLNIAQPTPSIGWKNSEQLSFLSKANNHFDMVLCLGLIHHLLVSERIPLNEILSLLGDLSKKYLLIEWINTNDEKFMEIASINYSLYENLTEDYFISLVSKNYKIKKRLVLKNAKRTLFLLEKKGCY